MADAVLVIAGPTASGKTAVAIEVARRLDGEIISMDSRQVYRRMNIGTAKPPAGERGGVPHHGFDLVEPHERFNAGRFAALARTWIAAVRDRGRVPVLVGGTGFFLRALTNPMFAEPELDPVLKEAWKRYLAGIPLDELQRWKGALDPRASIRAGDRQRIARLVEIAVLTGRTLAWWQRNASPSAAPIDPRVFVLDLPRDVLYRRIEARVDAMIDAGLVDEVRSLVAAGHDETSPGMNTTGYIELLPHLRGERSLDNATDMIRTATRQYARRQLTWLRHQLPPGAIWLDADAPAAEIAERIVGTWSQETS